ncbi:MAG: hypothetical protein OXI81_17765 [Paracoccaceae bacterium]|nr:hypothetical protein [Paracoccaceae bacterium]
METSREIQACDMSHRLPVLAIRSLGPGGWNSGERNRVIGAERMWLPGSGELVSYIFLRREAESL